MIRELLNKSRFNHMNPDIPRLSPRQRRGESHKSRNSLDIKIAVTWQDYTILGQSSIQYNVVDFLSLGSSYFLFHSTLPIFHPNP